MRRICVVTGSRADRGMLEWPIRLLSEVFDVEVFDVRHRSNTAWYAMRKASEYFNRHADEIDMVLLLGDRYEIMAAAMAAHLSRIPIAHIGGGDVTLGSYDDAMRDCVTRMATIHFVTNESAYCDLRWTQSLLNTHMVGSPGIDYIMHADWRTDIAPHPQPYQVVSYQPETIDGTNELVELIESLPKKLTIFILPNPDRGSDDIINIIRNHCASNPMALYYDELPHDYFLNLIAHCDEFIGNSSAMLYEAPTLGVKTWMVGKRQLGRNPITGDGRASERMVKVLQEYFA